MSFTPKDGASYSLYEIGLMIWTTDKSKLILTISTSGDCDGDSSQFKIYTETEPLVQTLQGMIADKLINRDFDIKFKEDNKVVTFHVTYKDGGNETWSIFGLNTRLKTMIEEY